MPGNSEQCRLNALLCSAQAAQATAPQSRQDLIAMADIWNKLAAELESDDRLLQAMSELELRGTLGSTKTSFSESDLAELERVYQSVCSTLGTLDEANKASVRRRLFLLACNGMRDPETLSARLVDSLRRSMGRAA
jgi:hypothetical protein